MKTSDEDESEHPNKNVVLSDCVAMKTVFLEGEQLQRWRQVGTKQSLTSDQEIAAFLLDTCETSWTKPSGERCQLCWSCHTPLTWFCFTCNQARTTHHALTPAPIPSPHFGDVCNDDDNDNENNVQVFDDSGLLKYCVVKVEDVANRDGVTAKLPAVTSPIDGLPPTANKTANNVQVKGRSRVRKQNTGTANGRKTRKRKDSCKTNPSLKKGPVKQEIHGEVIAIKEENEKDDKGDVGFKAEEEDTEFIQIVNKVEHRPYKCSQCSKAFKKRAHCRDHETTHAEIKPHKCDLCPAAFHSHHNLITHRRKHTGEKPFECHICQKAFARSGNMRRHLRTHGSKYMHQCEMCPHMFVDKNALLRHYREQHAFERPFTCDQCEASFRLQHHLTAHLLWHANPRPYLCEECGASFKRKYALEEHTRIHKGIRPFSCDLCGQSFYRQGNLQDHKRSHMNIRDFMCTVCGEAFLRNNTLKRHMQMKHTRNRPHKCEECGKTFAFKFDLNKHARTLCGEKQCVCDVCGRRFLQMNNMERHRKRHHKDAPPYMSSEG